MKAWLGASLLFAGLLVLCLPMSAHHGGASTEEETTEFKNVTVTKFAWANPHCLVFFDVKDANGKVVNWAAETGAPQQLLLNGWHKTILKPGDIVTVYMRVAKSGQPAGRFSRIVMADGTVVGEEGVNAAPPSGGGFRY